MSSEFLSCQRRKERTSQAEVVRVREEGMSRVAVQNDLRVRQTLGRGVACERVDHDVVGAGGDEHGKAQLVKPIPAPVPTKKAIAANWPCATSGKTSADTSFSRRSRRRNDASPACRASSARPFPAAVACRDAAGPASGHDQPRTRVGGNSVAACTTEPPRDQPSRSTWGRPPRQRATAQTRWTNDGPRDQTDPPPAHHGES